MSTNDGSFGHATNKTPRPPNIALDKDTLSKLNQLSHKNEALANCMCDKLQNYRWGWDTAKDLCEKELKRNREHSIKMDAFHKDTKRAIERDAHEKTKRKIQTDKEETTRKIALDRRIKTFTTPKRVKIPFNAKVTEHAYCIFCDRYHATTIQVGPREFRNFSLDSYHVTDNMRVNAQGHDKIPTDRERCILALTVDNNCSEDEANRKCDQLLNDPLIVNRFLRNPRHEKIRTQTKEDSFIASMVAHQNIHPGIPQAIFKHDIEKRSQYINWLMSSGRLTNRKGQLTTSSKPVSQLEECIREHMMDDGLNYEEAKELCKHGEKH